MALDLFRIPTIEDRVSVVGSTGEGKTQFSVWLLSLAHFDQIPYVIVDYKREAIIGQLNAKEIGYKELPKQPGLYVLRPGHNEGHDMEGWLGRVYERGNTGLYFDEAYSLPNSGPQHSGYLRTIYTQGRSLRIPTITLTQQPAHITSFAFSEAQHRAVFYLNRPKDRKTILEYLPEKADIGRLPKYHSLWYSSGERQAVTLLPVPDSDTLIAQVNDRLAPRNLRRVI